MPSPALISIFSPSTPSVHGYVSKPLTSAAFDVIDLKKNSEIERNKDRDRDRDRDTPSTGDPLIHNTESSCTTGDTDNNTTIDNKNNNNNSNHSSVSTNGSDGDGSQNIDDKDGLLALEGLLSLSKY